MQICHSTTFLSHLINSEGLSLASNRIRNLKGISCIQLEAMLTSQTVIPFPLTLQWHKLSHCEMCHHADLVTSEGKRSKQVISVFLAQFQLDLTFFFTCCSPKNCKVLERILQWLQCCIPEVTWTTAGTLHLVDYPHFYKNAPDKTACHFTDIILYWVQTWIFAIKLVTYTALHQQLHCSD